MAEAWMDGALLLEKLISLAVGLARRVHAGGLIYQVRNRAARGLVKPLHLNVLHRMRRLIILMEDWDKDRDNCVLLAQQIASECRVVMGRLLELNSNQLHCCIKVLTDDGRVATWVRSEPCDDRPVEQGAENAHNIETNSVWSALSGNSDGATNWRPFTCFACNDLTAHGDLFKCDRGNWQRYYRSTLVFPLRYPKDSHGTEFQQLGFLAFDSPKPKAFRGVPDIFEFRENPTAYRDLLEASTAFNLGAIIADTLGAILGGIYERRAEHGGQAK